MADQLVRALLDPPRVRVVAALTTDTVREAARRHGTVGAATVALGRALTSGVLLATLTKGDERVTLQIAGDGPITQISVDADGEGHVRGYLSPHGVAVALGKQQRPSIAPAVGRGQVMVMRDLGLKEQYRGTASIVTGEIDEDVEAYLRQSEQLDSALGCEVIVDAHGAVVRAGGLLVQAMPGGEPELIRDLQHQLRTGVLYRALDQDAPADAEAIARAVLGPCAERRAGRDDNLALDFLEQRPVAFRCRCSAERATQMLALLDLDEIEDMIHREGQAEITCNFCSERYLIDKSALVEVRNHIAQRPREKN